MSTKAKTTQSFGHPKTASAVRAENRAKRPSKMKSPGDQTKPQLSHGILESLICESPIHPASDHVSSKPPFGPQDD
jgi:hypothetical protein